MNNHFIEYKETQNKVVEVLDKAIAFYTKFELDSMANSSESLKKQTIENEFTIVVVGEFSAGKSTFINALMGDRYLPSATKETTATVNFLRHIDQSKDGSNIVVYYKDGSVERIKQEVSLENINAYVSTNGDDVANKIEKVDIFLESKFLENNVTIVDSPGLNGTADGHRDITMEQISKSHACIFMFDARQPGKQTDFDFLDKIREKTSNLFFLLNQVDVIKSDEGETIESVKDSVKQNYKKEIGVNTAPELYGVSSIKALVARGKNTIEFNNRKDYSENEKQEFLLESYISEFEDRLLRFLTKGEKAKSQFTEPVNKVENDLKLLYNKLNEDKEALNQTRDGDDLDEAIIKEKEDLNSLSDRLDEKQKDLKKAIRRSKDDAKNNLRDSKRRLVDETENFINSLLDNIEDSLADNDVSSIEKRFQKHVERRVEEVVQSAYDIFTSGVTVKVDGIETEISSEFSLNDNSLKFESEIDISELEKVEDKFNKLEEENNDRIKEINKRKRDAKNSESEIKKIENELIEAKEDKKRIEKDIRDARLESNPNSKYSTDKRMVENRKWRGGAGGIIWTLIAGKKVTQDEEVVYVENKDYNVFEEEKSAKTEIFKESISDISVQEKGLKEEYAKLKQQSLSVEDVEEEKIEIKKKHEREQNKLEKEIERKVKRIKNSLESSSSDYIRTILRIAETTFKKEVDDNAKEIESDAIEHLNVSLSEKIKLKRLSIDNKNKLKESSDTEKKEKLAKIDETLSDMKKIQISLMEVNSDLDSMIVDVVEQEEICELENA